ncbi:hypothetical protein N0B44_13865 [Roseibacterium beibuensis]|uniref:NADH-quinone oxidoreductase subunit E n=1 Tax=[Roseibacterium] beibuensis TaxID=1193142 RepID=A0ABP9L9V3_9RHOB|nr:hypothetical protein [Roseibacterium beibuensis]MCS6624000.1 hypothetical protein [Roseibacterium beibuensis]
MNLAEDIWLRGQAAQRSFLELSAYNVAFLSNATVQAIELGLTAPSTFWSAIGRAGRADLASETSDPSPVATVVPLHEAPAPVAETPEVVADAPVAEEALGPSPHLLDAPRGGVADDLTELKGVGAKLAEALNEFGIFHFDQIATLDEDGVAWLNDQQPGFKMTCARYDLIAQAQARTA